MLESYKKYLGASGLTPYDRAVNKGKHDLSLYGKSNPDYKRDAKRNGVVQPMIFTRSGDEHCYNVICMPGDVVWAGDLIDAFGEKYLVIEARPDATTHMVGKMMECNHLFRFQNFDSTIIERWGIIDQSGYSSTVRGTNQVQTSEEQVAIYLPYDKDTEKIYVDKRLSSHIGYDQTGRKILNSYKVTSCSPNTRAFNAQDHLLMLKAVRSVYSESTDNIDLQICDYISESATPTPVTPDPALLKCEITGKPSILLGRSKTFSGVFYASDGTTVDTSISAVWTFPEIKGVVFTPTGNQLRVSVQNQDSLIGTSMDISLSDSGSKYAKASISVEVNNIV
jgi:hypothetical protein